MKRFTLTLLLSLGAITLSLGVTQAMAAFHRTDEEFITKAAEDGQAEVALDYIAPEHARSPRVRAFGTEAAAAVAPLISIMLARA